MHWWSRENVYQTRLNITTERRQAEKFRVNKVKCPTAPVSSNSARAKGMHQWSVACATQGGGSVFIITQIRRLPSHAHPCVIINIFFYCEERCTHSTFFKFYLETVCLLHSDALLLRSTGVHWCGEVLSGSASISGTPCTEQKGQLPEYTPVHARVSTVWLTSVTRGTGRSLLSVINVKKLWFIHELTAHYTSKTAKITKKVITHQHIA